MTLFYDPLKRQPHPWVIPVFIIVGIFVIIALYAWGQQKAKTSKATSSQNQSDLFAR